MTVPEDDCVNANRLAYRAFDREAACVKLRRDVVDDDAFSSIRR